MIRLSLLIATLAASIAPACFVQGEEPAEVFLEALRDNGYYDVAIDYLNELEKGDLITPEFEVRCRLKRLRSSLEVPPGYVISG